MATIQDLINAVPDTMYEYTILYRKDRELLPFTRNRKSIRDGIVNSIIFPIFKKKITHGENSWSLHKLKVKNSDEKEVNAMRSMLNKMTDRTYEKFATISKEMNYESPEIIALIFKKIVMEHKNTDLYVNFCEKLYDMSIFSEICFDQFTSSEEQLNLCPFIANLYNRDIITNLQDYVDLILNDSESDIGLTDENIITLATLLKNVIILNKKTSKSLESFIGVITDLSNEKDNHGSRCRCIIMDLEDLIKK